MNKKEQHIIYIDTEVFFTVLKNNDTDELTYTHLQKLIDNEDFCIKISKYQYLDLHKTRINDKENKRILSEITLKLINYFLDKRKFVITAQKDSDPYTDFIHFIIEDLQQGKNVILISNNTESIALLRKKCKTLDLKNFYIIKSQEFKQWLEQQS